ncbi:acetylglutamate kinase [Candidatus Foliamicus sp.]
MNRKRPSGAGFAALRAAAPYLRLYRDRVFVVKLGGEVLSRASRIEALVEQAAVLQALGIRVVIVHGGGPQSTELTARLQHEARMVAGRRVTGPEDLKVATYVLNGEVNTRLLSACRACGVSAVGLSGVDAGLVVARRRPPARVEGAGEEPVDFGFVGDIQEVRPAVLKMLLKKRFLPIVSPLSADANGGLLNINADTVAAAVAVALNAEKLVLTMAAPGILSDRADTSTLLSYLDLAGLRKLQAGGALADGMLPKAAAIEAAIKGGVPRVHLVSGSTQDALLREVFTNEGCGTMVVRSIDALSDAEQQAGRQ